MISDDQDDAAPAVLTPSPCVNGGPAALDTTDEKMMSDMPLPMPRWVMRLTHPHQQRGAGGERRAR